MRPDPNELRLAFESRIKDETDKVVQAFYALVHQSNSLAKAMGYNEDYVLVKVLPASAANRECPNRIVDWVEKVLPACVESLVGLELENFKTDEREALISSLQLTEEQRTLLGI